MSSKRLLINTKTNKAVKVLAAALLVTAATIPVVVSAQEVQFTVPASISLFEEERFRGSDNLEWRRGRVQISIPPLPYTVQDLMYPVDQHQNRMLDAVMTRSDIGSPEVVSQFQFCINPNNSSGRAVKIANLVRQASEMHPIQNLASLFQCDDPTRQRDFNLVIEFGPLSGRFGQTIELTPR